MMTAAILRMTKWLGTFSLMLSAPSALSAQTDLKTPPLSTAPESLDLATTLGSLVLVIGLILLLAWLLKRMKVPALGQQKGLRIVSQLPVGPKERIAVVQVGDEQILVGITSQSIQTLSKLETPLKEQDATNSAFANQFSQLMKRHDKE